MQHVDTMTTLTEDSEAAMEAAPGTPGQSDETRDTAKIRQILDGARRVFLVDGFDGASMNEIARESGVSKGTLYVYFESKEALFVALVRADRKHQAEQICVYDDSTGEPEAVLRRFGKSLLTAMTAPDSLAHIRTVIAVAGKNPAIGKAFYEAGPAHGTERLAHYLKRQSDAGHLNIDDALKASVGFMQLLQGDLFKRQLFGVLDRVTDEAVAACVDDAVTMFMRAYGAR